MEEANQTKQLILDAKNICLIPLESEPESLTSCLALFYTLKELGKNANLIIENFPEKLNFLIPSLGFISSPKNFVISIPKDTADVSQIYYEKNDDNLKIHLTVNKGKIKKENVNFYFQEPKPDLIITLGVKDFKKHLENKLDSFGFLLDAPIINIDNNQDNIKFGKINLVQEKSISQITLNLIKSVDDNLIKKSVANCLLAGLTLYYEDFKSKKTTPEIFEMAADLIKKGAEHQQIVEGLNQTSEKESDFLREILKQSKTGDELSVAVLDSDQFENFGETQAQVAMEKLKVIGIKNDFLVLWPSHASEPVVKGLFYSKKPDLLSKIAKNHQVILKKDGLFLSIPESDVNLAKEKIIKTIINE